MKKTNLLLLPWLCLLCLPLHAVTHTVEVSNFAFAPSTLTVNVGDTITWVWQSGGHTTTSTQVPAGATPWDEPISIGNPMYSYVVAVAGAYEYVCSLHPGMDGSFTALPSTGTVEATPLVWLTQTAAHGRLQVAYQLPAAADVELTLFDSDGRAVRTFDRTRRAAGTYTDTYAVRDLPRGLYVLVLSAGGQNIGRKVVLE
jgi:hypothetical protein